MAKASMPCPTPGCENELPVKKSAKGKPTVYCSDCGFQGFVRYTEGAKRWFDGDPEPAAAPKKKAKAEPTDKETAAKGPLDFWAAAPKKKATAEPTDKETAAKGPLDF